MMLSRRELLATLGMLGVGTAVFGCRSDTAPGDAGGDDAGTDDDVGRPVAAGAGSVTSVIVVGAGAAGLTAAHLLRRRGIEVTILEAAPVHGGRMLRDAEWVDFPVPLGAGWLHVEPTVLDEIVDDDTVEITTQFAAYGAGDELGIYDGQLRLEPLVDPDLLFVGSSWLDVFDEHVLPGIADRLRLESPVAEIEHSSDGVVVTEIGGEVHLADAVIVTVPPTILREGDIAFRPELPSELTDALGVVDIWGGLKVFLEFSEHFYPAMLVFPDSFTDAGQYLYYDAAHGQESPTNLLGLFAVGDPADRYRAASTDETIEIVLAELDGIFDGVASASYLGYRVQDWDDEPFVRQAYLADSNPDRLVRPLGRPISGRLILAGDSYSDGEDWGSVHVAVRSARAAVARLVDL